jgi:hypothetical protein
VTRIDDPWSEADGIRILVGLTRRAAARVPDCSHVGVLQRDVAHRLAQLPSPAGR